MTSILPFFLFFSFFFFFNHNVITLRQFGRVGYYLHLKKQKFLFFIFFPLFIFVHTISKKKTGEREREEKRKKVEDIFSFFSFGTNYPRLMLEGWFRSCSSIRASSSVINRARSVKVTNRHYPSEYKRAERTDQLQP